MILWIDGRNILHRRVIFDNVIEGVEGYFVLLLLGVELHAVVAELVSPEDLVREVGGADLDIVPCLGRGPLQRQDHLELGRQQVLGRHRPQRRPLVNPERGLGAWVGTV